MSFRRFFSLQVTMEYAELYSSYPYFMFTVYSSYAAKIEGYDEVYIWL